jgi:hypothetical protein
MARRANIAIPHLINLVLTGPMESHRDADAPVLHAAVHGWYEGHIEGEDSSGHAPGLPTTFPSNEMPSPPFPAPGPDSPVREIAAEVNERCGPADLNGRVALAAALGWIGGWAEGRDCPGCTPRGRENVEMAAGLRAGEYELVVRRRKHGRAGSP